MRIAGGCLEIRGGSLADGAASVYSSHCLQQSHFPHLNPPDNECEGEPNLSNIEDEQRKPHLRNDSTALGRVMPLQDALSESRRLQERPTIPRGGVAKSGRRQRGQVVSNNHRIMEEAVRSHPSCTERVNNMGV